MRPPTADLDRGSAHPLASTRGPAAATSTCRTWPGGPGARASRCSAPATSPTRPGSTTCASTWCRPSRAFPPAPGPRARGRRSGCRRACSRRSRPGSCSRVEISTIYKRDDRTRKVHHLIYLPDLDGGRPVQHRARAGSATSAPTAGPILGLDSRDLLEITLEASPDGYLVPAHIWTPWFSALGSKSGLRRDRRLLRRPGRAHLRGGDRAVAPTRR